MLQVMPQTRLSDLPLFIEEEYLKAIHLVPKQSGLKDLPVAPPSCLDYLFNSGLGLGSGSVLIMADEVERLIGTRATKPEPRANLIRVGGIGLLHLHQISL